MKFLQGYKNSESSCIDPIEGSSCERKAGRESERINKGCLQKRLILNPSPKEKDFLILHSEFIIHNS